MWQALVADWAKGWTHIVPAEQAGVVDGTSVFGSSSTEQSFYNSVSCSQIESWFRTTIVQHTTTSYLSVLTSMTIWISGIPALVSEMMSLLLSLLRNAAKLRMLAMIKVVGAFKPLLGRFVLQH